MRRFYEDLVDNFLRPFLSFEVHAEIEDED